MPGGPTIEQQVEIERSLCPAKISDGPMEVFIVPVRPRWAMHLFHVETASQDLFGAAPHLMLSVENVYFRSAKPGYPVAPSRVLWYISGGEGYGSASQLVGTSTVTSVEVGPATFLYRRFRRLGIYSWADVKATARDEAHGSIMAFTFERTELFANPIRWRELRELMHTYLNRRAPIMSPTKVPSELFQALYRIGTGVPAQ